MRFELALSLKGVSYYGNVPDFLNCLNGQSEQFLLLDSDWPLLNEDFVDSINDLCGTLLDNGDVDYFDAKQCALLNEWLSERLTRDCNSRLRFLYEKLQEFALRAIELGTGVVVEL